MKYANSPTTIICESERVGWEMNESCLKNMIIFAFKILPGL